MTTTARRAHRNGVPTPNEIRHAKAVLDRVEADAWRRRQRQLPTEEARSALALLRECLSEHPWLRRRWVGDKWGAGVLLEIAALAEDRYTPHDEGKVAKALLSELERCPDLKPMHPDRAGKDRFYMIDLEVAELYNCLLGYVIELEKAAKPAKEGA